MSSATPRRDGNEHNSAACNAGDALSPNTQCTTPRSSVSTAFAKADATTLGFAVTGDHGKVQDSPLQRTRCQHARIMVHVVLL